MSDTTTTSTANGTDRHAAVAAWAQSALDGTPLTGAQLGERYGRSESWGRGVIRDAREEAASLTVPAADVPRQGDGNHQARRGAAATAARFFTVMAVLLVAGVAAVVSYVHMRHLALVAGEGWRADLVPLSVDGMMVAASLTLLTKRWEGKRAPLAWVALLLGVAASLAANVASAEPTVYGRAVAFWPPVALVLAFELLLQQGRSDGPAD